jgi:TPR repeat protein
MMGIVFLGRWLSRLRKPALDSTSNGSEAKAGDGESQFNLGRDSAKGNAAPREDAQAVGWYLKAANQGDCEAQYSLGLMYRQGPGLLRDEAQAVRWLRQAAGLGHAGAQYHLGLGQHRASRGTRDGESSECRIEAFKWLQLAVAQRYRGAESAQEIVTLTMTREEVHEGSQRAAAFAAAQAKPVAAC